MLVKIGELKLREFYYELNPLIPFIPVPSSATEEVLPLKVKMQNIKANVNLHNLGADMQKIICHT